MNHSSHSGHTLLEILVASAAFLLLMTGLYGLIYCAKTLTFKNVATNTTGAAAHLTLDKIQSLLQQAYTIPIPIDSTGANVTGTLSLTGTAATASGLIPVVSGSQGTVTGTGAGIKFYSYVGGPYLTLITGTAGLSGSATSLSIQLDTQAQVPVPLPQPGDKLLIKTTALLSGSGYQVWATVSGSATLIGSSGTLQTYAIPLTPPLKDSAENGNTVSGIQYQTDNTGINPVSWSTSLMRPTAFLISIRNSKTEMGMLQPYISTGTNTISTGSNYTTLTTELDPTTPSCFSIVSLNSASFIGVTLSFNSSEFGNYFGTGTGAGNKQYDGFATFMGLSSLIQLKSLP
ncbi:MAG: hypothetical protein WCH57_03105 [Verrucomicrobiota bacterium]